MIDSVHLYLIADAPTCFSSGKGQFVLVCDECFVDVEKWLAENGWTYLKNTKVNAPCIRCERERYPEQSAEISNRHFPEGVANSLLFNP